MNLDSDRKSGSSGKEAKCEQFRSRVEFQIKPIGGEPIMTLRRPAKAQKAIVIVKVKTNA